ncbi:hypothetical protein [Desulfogranum marinum]|uniref:hypothetical protein n=1 Tax=Desulfogranum marinum TaxID=453220 RepID=UPI001962BD47|nr:hypothetical protein [Desulfogranum marinum]MBM9511466.1 hypothetical protein [Desulfogranum marinum]
MHIQRAMILICFSLFFLLVIVEGYAAQAESSFSGTWSANGTKEGLSFGKDREVALFKLAGLVHLQDSVGTQTDYWSECIGLGDTQNGSDIRCVWRSLDGQQVYIVLQAKQMAEGTLVTGEIVGGTGNLAGIKGTLGFQWSTLSFQGTGKLESVGGYAKGLKGTYILP